LKNQANLKEKEQYEVEEKEKRREGVGDGGSSGDSLYTCVISRVLEG
jgi:hypothetical protein